MASLVVASHSIWLAAAKVHGIVANAPRLTSRHRAGNCTAFNSEQQHTEHRSTSLGRCKSKEKCAEFATKRRHLAYSHLESLQPRTFNAFWTQFWCLPSELNKYWQEQAQGWNQPTGWFLHHLLEHHQLQGPTHLEQDWLKGFSTGTAISCRGKVTCIQCYRVMCAWERGKSTEARVRSEDDCHTGSPQKTTRSPQQCLGASGVVGCNCNDCYTCVVYANTAVQLPFFTHTLSYFPY